MKSDLFQKYIFLFIILTAFLTMVAKYHWTLPWRADDLYYCMLVDKPFYDFSVFFRYFHYFLAKIFNILFFPLNTLEACAVLSVIYSIGVISCSYYIIVNLAGRTAAIISAIFVSSYPTIIYQATWFGSDIPTLFFGLVSVSFLISKNKRTWLRFACSGFFLIASIYSKRTGICFVIPIAIMLLNHSSKKELLSFFYGVLACFLFMAICDFIWLDNFFLHLNPLNYFDFLSWFDGRVDSARSRTGYGIKWSATYLLTLCNYRYFHILLFAIVSLVLISTNTEESKKHRVYFAFAIFLISICSFTLHEAFHCWSTRLPVFPRYMLTMNIPFILSFCILLPCKIISEKNENQKEILFDCILVVYFIFIFFITRHYGDYYYILRTKWTLLNSILHVFSFWILLAGVGFTFYCGNFLHTNSKPIKRSYQILLKTGFFAGIVIIISYSVFWGNDFSQNRTNKYIKTIDNQFRSFESIYKNNSDKIMMYHLPRAGENSEFIRELRNIFQYLTLKGLMDQSDYNRHFHMISHIKEIPIKNIALPQYQYLLTKHSPKEVNKMVSGYRIKMKIIWEYNSLYLYQKM